VVGPGATDDRKLDVVSDDTDELADPAVAAASVAPHAQTTPPADATADEPVGWPLVERRSRMHTPPGGVDRRALRRDAFTSASSLSAAPLWPFRLAAVAGVALRASGQVTWSNWPLIVFAVIVFTYTAYACAKPVPYVDDSRVRLRIVVEQALHTVAIMATGTWSSPFVFMLVPSSMMAGLAIGGLFAAQLAAATIVAVTLQDIASAGLAGALRQAGLWGVLLALMAYTSGLAHRASADAARAQQVASERVASLAEANSLLFALQRVTRTLPASLDLDEVLESTVRRVRSMIEPSAVAVYLMNERELTIDPIRVHGFDEPVAHPLRQLPLGLDAALASPKTVRVDDLPAGQAISPNGRSGLYATLRARGAVVGMLAVESDAPRAFGQQQAEIVHGLAEPFGIAIDNARMFRQIHTVGADEERARIARDLHDHIGSSLALIGFEVDRAATLVGDHSDLAPMLHELRAQVSAVVADVRETLHDLRTEVDDTNDLRTTIVEHLQRVQARSGIAVDPVLQVDGRLPVWQERELWQIAREAITNVERHSRASRMRVTLAETPDSATMVIRDDGVGLGDRRPPTDRFGLVGMRERAERLGAQLTLRSPAKGGTEVRVDLPAPGSEQP
jgi:signal transduction histidine kinase